MGLINTIKNKLPTIRTTRHTQYNTNTQTHPITRQHNANTYYNALKNNEVYNCITVYQNTALACGFNIDSDTMENDNIPTTHYLQTLFNSPLGVDGNQTWSDTNNMIWSSFLAMGDCFFEISTDENYNMLNGFKYIPNKYMTYNNDTECYGLSYDQNVEFEPGDLVHIHQPNIDPQYQAWGISVISRCEEYIALLVNALRYNNQILLNDGINPNDIISFDKDTPDRVMISEIERIQAKREDTRNNLRAGRRGNGTLILRGANWTTGVNTNRDMSYLELMKYARDTIIRTFGVPPQLAGVIETANLGSGSGDSQKKDWKMTFEGKSKFVENAFNTTLRRYGFSERFQYENIDVIDDLYDAQVAEIYIRNGVKTVDEVRNEQGLDKLSSHEHEAWTRYFQ
ncbi:MAG: hypothetical protein BZ138_07400 [Methanosphaera sp. rholeuAM270]|nr:MAG: hypothetical protein BZ138_07400 [Methanosphaera sp. rholeuAM270]